MANLCVGITATRAAWSSALRSYLRDHTQGISVEVVMDRAGLLRLANKLDILVVDDIMRLFSEAELSRVMGNGVTVFGLFDDQAGLGRGHLFSLGIERVIPASTSPPEVASLFAQIEPRQRGGPALETAPWPGVGREVGAEDKPQGLVSVWTKVSGGSGLTEAVIAAAQFFARRRRVLVIELDEVAPVLVSRLSRSPDTGLTWALSRAALGQPVLPNGLSGPRADGAPPCGRFDAMCNAQGAHHVVEPANLRRLLNDVRRHYEHVIVEACWAVGSPSDRERFAATRTALAMADRLVVIAAADPEGAARLVEWQANASAVGISAPAWAAFGRANSNRYERAHLANLTTGSTLRRPFAGVTFLPEDATVRRARWNGEMVWKGRWLRAVESLAAQSARPGVPKVLDCQGPISIDFGHGERNGLTRAGAP